VTDPIDLQDDRALRAVVFDFDGLIIDSETTALRSWQELYAAYGEEVPVEKKWVNLIGTWDADWSPAAELEARIGHPLDWDTLESERRAREIALADEQPLLPGVLDALDAATALRLRLAIASSSSLAWVERHLLRLGIYDRFEALITRDDVVRTKPDPELFVRALEALGVRADEAFAFEDSVHGVTAAKGAGMRVVAVPGPLMRDRDFTAADLRLESLEDMPLARILERLTGVLRDDGTGKAT
jgi:HAD superfamily hydrolase (TIGR01509 family)